MNISTENQNEEAIVLKEQPAHSWDDLTMVQIPSGAITGRDVLIYLQDLAIELNVVEELVKNKILEEEFEHYKIEASESETENAINEFRVGKHLLTGSATQKWLEKKYMSNSDLWDHFEKQVMTEKLKTIVCNDENVRDEFIMRRTTLAKVLYYQIVVKQEKKAAELAALIKAGNSFFDLAKKYSEDLETKMSCGFCGTKYIFEFEPEIQFRLTASSDGDVLGPIKSIGQYYLIFVERFYPAVLDNQTKNDIRNMLFTIWSNQRVSSTPIEMVDPY